MHALLLVCALSAYAPQDAPNGWAYDLDDLSNIYAHSNYHLSLEFQANGPTTIVLDDLFPVDQEAPTVIRRDLKYVFTGFGSLQASCENHAVFFFSP